MTTKTSLVMLFGLFGAACSSAIAEPPRATPAAEAVCRGGEVASDAALRKFADCTRVDGDLVLNGVSDLEPLAHVHAINGTLSIGHTSALYSLSGLERLCSVDALRLTYNARLIDASALDGVKSVQRIEIAHNPRLCARFGLLTSLQTPAAKADLRFNAGLSSADVQSLAARWTHLSAVASR
ncbi:MAG TPA: hypothetical protein VGM29_19575 [Polyangiaceae bacterium]